LEFNGNLLAYREYAGGRQLRCQQTETNDPLAEARRILASLRTAQHEKLPPFFGGFIGFFGYEAARWFEKVPVFAGDGEIPDGLMVMPEVVLVYDMMKRSLHIIACSFPGADPGAAYDEAVARIRSILDTLAAPTPAIAPKQASAVAKTSLVHSNLSREQYMTKISACQQHIRNGEIIQLVVAQKFQLDFSATPFAIYRALRTLNPSPYLFYLNFGRFILVGSSPEVMVRLQNREILLKPIAGTRPRGATLAEDARLEKELLENTKERAEHLMLVDLARNDLGRVAVPGSVEVRDFMTVEKYSHVMHIVSTVKAEMEAGYDVFDLIRATFPAGTVTGAPKIRAMELIADLEEERRGPYAGMVFNLGLNGNLDSCITIRTALLRNGQATVQAGAGIVAYSDPAQEFTESCNKAEAVLKAIQLAEKGGTA
jgi:anthranilate synthase component 1